KKGLDLGVNFVDTAEIYGQGLSEKLVGEAIRERRDDVVIATKVSPWHLRYGGVIKAANRSLERLGVSTIDLYQIHFPNPVFPIKNTMRAMEKLVTDGKVRHIGVSNFGVKKLREAQEATKSNEIVSNQVKYNMVERSIEKELLEYSKSSNVTILAYSPLAQGVLVGRQPSSMIQSANILFAPQNLKQLEPLLETLRDIAVKRGKTMAQVALNWLLKDEIVILIPGIKKVKHVEDNIGAADWRLTQNELERIEKAFGSFKKEKRWSYPRMLLRLLLRR
ncbi:MAG: aldo/keto reductase, partial [Nitrososphaerales archaeon]